MAISYAYKGESHQLIFRSDNISDYCYYQKQIPRSKEWRTILLPVSKLRQPSWGKPVNFKVEAINGLAWQVMGKTNDSGKIALDDLRLLYSLPPELVSEAKLNKQQYQEDLNQLVDLLKKHHPNLYAFTPKDEFEAFVKQQYGKITDTLSLRDFFTLASPIVEKIKCGHSSLLLPEEYWAGDQFAFPLKLVIEKGKAYVLEEGALPMGTEITRINGKKSNEIVPFLRSFISSDAGITTAKNKVLNDFFDFYYGNYLGHPSSYQVQYRDKKGKEKTIKLEAKIVTNYAKNLYKNSLSLPKLKIQKDVKTAVLAIQHFDYYQNRVAFYDFIDSAFAILASQHIAHLILDLRDNGGGDPFCSNYLLSHLFPISYSYYSQPYAEYHYEALARPTLPAKNCFEGKLAVLINGRCFSSTGQLCSLLKYHQRGIFIGEETGGTFTCNAAVETVTLYHSELRLKVAQKIFATAVQGMPASNGILPDYPVADSIQDKLEGKDAVLEKAWEVLGK